LELPLPRFRLGVEKPLVPDAARVGDGGRTAIDLLAQQGQANVADRLLQVAVCPRFKRVQSGIDNACQYSRWLTTNMM
jgi:hypothetical protein